MIATYVLQSRNVKAQEGNSLIQWIFGKVGGCESTSIGLLSGENLSGDAEPRRKPVPREFSEPLGARLHQVWGPATAHLGDRAHMR